MRLSSTGTGAAIEAGPWRPAFDIAHRRVAVTILFALVGAAVFFGVEAMPGSGLLLIGSAVIGLPHGMSDFLVARRLWRPTVGRAWLPAFVCGYLAVVGSVMVGWNVAPVSTLLVFLIVSSLHFSAADGSASSRSKLQAAARALTPVLPIFMFHPDDVGRALALMVDGTPARAVQILAAVRQVALWPYLIIIAAAVSGSLSNGLRKERDIGSALELLALALAAWLLPPFLTFAIYFCFLHALRHMAGIASTAYPDQAGPAFTHAARIILPCSMLCMIALCCLWDRAAGFSGSDALIAYGLQLLAALTVPHMALEGFEARRWRGSTPTPGALRRDRIMFPPCSCGNGWIV